MLLMAIVKRWQPFWWFGSRGAVRMSGLLSQGGRAPVRETQIISYYSMLRYMRCWNRL